MRRLIRHCFAALICLICFLFCGTACRSETEKTNIDAPDPVKRVAFTFDDGPHAVYTCQIVDKLIEIDGKATFFVLGNRLTDKDNEKAMKYAAAAGCEIGTHGFSHLKHYDDCSDEDYDYEINWTAKLIADRQEGKPVTLMRPVGGRISEERVKNSSYAVVLWNVDPRDWEKKEDGERAEKNVQSIVDSVLDHVKDGDIILMHDIYQNSVDAFCRIADALKKEGYEFVTVSELLNSPAPGKRYFSVQDAGAVSETTPSSKK